MFCLIFWIFSCFCLLFECWLPGLHFGLMESKLFISFPWFWFIWCSSYVILSNANYVACHKKIMPYTNKAVLVMLSGSTFAWPCVTTHDHFWVHHFHTHYTWAPMEFPHSFVVALPLSVHAHYACTTIVSFIPPSHSHPTTHSFCWFLWNLFMEFSFQIGWFGFSCFLLDWIGLVWVFIWALTFSSYF